MNNGKRQTWQERNRIIAKYLYALTNDKQRLVCFLFMNNVKEKEICKAVKISPVELKDIKLQLAIGLRQAGIRIAED